MLWITLKRVIEVEPLLAEEHTGFRRGSSPVEEIINLRIFCEQADECQSSDYHNFIDPTLSHWFSTITRALFRLERTMNLLCH